MFVLPPKKKRREHSKSSVYISRFMHSLILVESVKLNRDWRLESSIKFMLNCTERNTCNSAYNRPFLCIRFRIRFKHTNYSTLWHAETFNTHSIFRQIETKLAQFHDHLFNTCSHLFILCVFFFFFVLTLFVRNLRGCWLIWPNVGEKRVKTSNV